MKKLLLCLLFSASLFSCSDELQKESDNSTRDLGVVTAFQASLNLENSFITTRSSGQAEKYPNYYGGGYISDKDELVVLVRQGFNKESVKTEIQNRSKSSSIVIKECNYSFNDLMELNDNLSKLYCENDNLVKRLHWFSVGISPEKNRISVCLFDCSDENIQNFKSEVSDSQMIIFEKIDAFSNDVEVEEIADSVVHNQRATTKTNVHAGSLISRIGKATSNGKIITATLKGSVGFRAMVGNTHGFITAAHCAPEVNMKFNWGNSTDYLGTVSQIAKAQKVDAAFVTVDFDKYYPTNVTQWSKTVYQSKYLVTNNFMNSIANQSMVVEGQATQKSIKVKVIKLHNTQTTTGFGTDGKPVSYPIAEVVCAEFVNPADTTKSGDSGGIVYTETGAYLGGIHIGKGIIESKKVEAFSSAEHALKAFEASLTWK